jgi:hypothetical protein
MFVEAELARPGPHGFTTKHKLQVSSGEISGNFLMKNSSTGQRVAPILMAMATNNNDVQIARAGALRRSQRVCLDVDVEVTMHAGTPNSVTERTSTVVVSSHGALVIFKYAASVGDLLTLRIVKTKEQVDCRVVDISDARAEIPKIGVEFVEPRGNLWHVAFPPPDWTPRSAEAKSYSPQLVKSSATDRKP